MVTGLNAAVAVLLALNERGRSGLGQFLDITLYDCAVSLLHPHAANYFYSGKVPGRTGNAHPNIAPYETLPPRGGPIFLAVGDRKSVVSGKGWYVRVNLGCRRILNTQNRTH